MKLHSVLEQHNDDRPSFSNEADFKDASDLMRTDVWRKLKFCRL